MSCLPSQLGWPRAQRQLPHPRRQCCTLTAWCQPGERGLGTHTITAVSAAGNTPGARRICSTSSPKHPGSGEASQVLVRDHRPGCIFPCCTHRMSVGFNCCFG